MSQAPTLPPLPPTIKKAFIGYLDTHFGATLARRLLGNNNNNNSAAVTTTTGGGKGAATVTATTAPQNTNSIEVSGLLRDPLGKVPCANRIKKAFRRNDTAHTEAIRAALLEADFIVYELVDGIDDAIAALRLLTRTHFDTPKRFVLVSSFLSWFETPLLRGDGSGGGGAALDYGMVGGDGGEGGVDGGDTNNNADAEPLTEDQYNRRVPHAKYLAWRDVEKLCGSIGSAASSNNTNSAASALQKRLQTFVMFSGLQYGGGESTLLPLFKQAWCLGQEGLPVYGSGKQRIPMIHVADAAMIAHKLLITGGSEDGDGSSGAGGELPTTNRYIFAVDDASTANASPDEPTTATWRNIVHALNKHLGNGKTFRVPRSEYCLHDNVEQFTIDLKVEPQAVGLLVPNDDDWVCKGGFVEHMESLIAPQFRQAHGLAPMRILMAGPPLSGKSYAAREIAQRLSLPHFTIADAVADYRFQLVELQEELQRLRQERYEQRVQSVKDEHIAAYLEERRAQREERLQELAAGGGATGANQLPDEDDDDVEEEEEFDVNLSPEELQEIAAATLNGGDDNDDGGDERATAIKEQLEEVKKVLAMKFKPIAEHASSLNEPPHPAGSKNAKAAAAAAAKSNALKQQQAAAAAAAAAQQRKKSNAGQSLMDNDANSLSMLGGGDSAVRLSDRALAIILRWKLSRAQCRNMGYVLDGYPKTRRQARLLFEDAELEVMEDPDEPDLPLDPEEKQCLEAYFPDVVLVCKASDTFLLERLQRTQHEHPHNNPEDFQRRLDHYKTHFEGSNSVYHYFESARMVPNSASGGAGAALSSRTASSSSGAGGSNSNNNTSGMMKVCYFDAEASRLVPPPPPKSVHAPRPLDGTIAKMLEAVGSPHNFGPTPQDTKREADRQRLFEAELQAEEDAQNRKVREEESREVQTAAKAKEEETMRLTQMKEQERQMLEERKAPLKAYLMRSVIPILTKGLIEVCNRRPEDPVDYLAEWLFRHNPEDDGMY